MHFPDAKWFLPINHFNYTVYLKFHICRGVVCCMSFSETCNSIGHSSLEVWLPFANLWWNLVSVMFKRSRFDYATLSISALRYRNWMFLHQTAFYVWNSTAKELAKTASCQCWNYSQHIPHCERLTHDMYTNSVRWVEKVRTHLPPNFEKLFNSIAQLLS